ncbi:hypothetical protein BOTBODRAFT_164328, partial [Botryobasidium botryosum FD-172 SS1]
MRIENAHGCIRVLLVGRAGAGKTTILEAIADGSEVCTSGDLVHSDDSDDLVHEAHFSPDLMKPATLHGLHNIKTQLIFKNWPNFIFHDSLGLEVGSDYGLWEAQQFIDKCNSDTAWEKKLHAICTILSGTEREFLRACQSKKVSLVIICT